MCTSYESSEYDRFEAFSLFSPPAFDYKREIYKDYVAPIFRRGADGFSTDPAAFGMMPRKRIPQGVKVFDTMNARAESVGQKPSFSGAWKSLQVCLVPGAGVFEPNYETGKAVRWRIGMASGKPFAIAGLWRAWEEPAGTSLSFTMLTVNSDTHSLMHRFHQPGDEKRSVVILGQEEYGDWLGCRSTDEARSFLQWYPADLMRAEAHPLPSRKSKVAAVG